MTKIDKESQLVGFGCSDEHGIERHDAELKENQHCSRCGAIPIERYIEINSYDDVEFFIDAIRVNGNYFKPNKKGEAIKIVFKPKWIEITQQQQKDLEAWESLTKRLLDSDTVGTSNHLLSFISSRVKKL